MAFADNALPLWDPNSGQLTPVSAGILLFVVASGRLPFEQENLATMYSMMTRSEYNVPLWFSPELSKIVALMLQPDPEKR